MTVVRSREMGSKKGLEWRMAVWDGIGLDWMMAENERKELDW